MTQTPDLDDTERRIAHSLAATLVRHCGDCGRPLEPKRTCPGYYGCPCEDPGHADRLVCDLQRRQLGMTVADYEYWRAGHEGRNRAVRLLRAAFGDGED